MIIISAVWYDIYIYIVPWFYNTIEDALYYCLVFNYIIYIIIHIKRNTSQESNIRSWFKANCKSSCKYLSLLVTT